MTAADAPIPSEVPSRSISSAAGTSPQRGSTTPDGEKHGPDGSTDVAPVARESDPSDLDSLMRFFGVEEALVGKANLVGFLRSIGVSCPAATIERLVAEGRRPQSAEPQRVRIFSHQDVAALVKSLTRASLADILALKKREKLHRVEPAGPQPLRSMDSLFVVYLVDRLKVTFTPLVSTKDMRATHDHMTAREWFLGWLTGQDWLLVRFTRSIECMPTLGLRRRIARAPVHLGEPPPTLAYYRVKNGRLEFARVPATVYGYERTECEIPAIVPLSHPKRLEIVEFVLEHFNPCWLLLWTQGISVAPGTLDPIPETEVQTRLVRDLVAAKRAYRF